MCRQYVGYAASHAATLPPFPPWENVHGIKIKISVTALISKMFVVVYGPKVVNPKEKYPERKTIIQNKMSPI